ncbi:MAG: TolC family protein [Desulfamplus sp.]|nr:TolC family protein [Desulfamplus sp.]
MMNYTQKLLIVSILFAVCFIMFSCTVVHVQKRDDIQEKLPEQYTCAKIIASDCRLFWNQSFPSESLQSDVQNLHKNNFEIEAARARIKQAAAAYGIAKSEILPSIDVKADFKSSRLEDASTNRASTQNNISFEAALIWEPDIWGRIRLRKEAEFLLFEEKQAMADMIALNMQSLLVETWIIYHGASMLEQILHEQLQTNKQLLDLTELRLAQGDGNALDILQQSGLLASIQRKLPAVSSEKVHAANAYAVLMGKYPGSGYHPDGKWPILERLSETSSPRNLMIDRPDLRASFLALKSADHEAAAAIADRLPRLSIGLTYAESGKTVSNIADSTVFSFASGLLTPIFDAARLKASSSLKQAQALEAVSILKQTMITAVREAEDAFSRENAIFDELILMQNEISIAAETVDKAKLQYVNGKESFLSVLVALTNLQTLQQEEIVLKQELLINRCRLLKALGAKSSKKHEIS